MERPPGLTVGESWTAKKTTRSNGRGQEVIWSWHVYHADGGHSELERIDSRGVKGVVTVKASERKSRPRTSRSTITNVHPNHTTHGHNHP